MGRSGRSMPPPQERALAALRARRRRRRETIAAAEALRPPRRGAATDARLALGGLGDAARFPTRLGGAPAVARGQIRQRRLGDFPPGYEAHNPGRRRRARCRRRSRRGAARRGRGCRQVRDAFAEGLSTSLDEAPPSRSMQRSTPRRRAPWWRVRSKWRPRPPSTPHLRPAVGRGRAGPDRRHVGDWRHRPAQAGARLPRQAARGGAGMATAAQARW